MTSSSIERAAALAALLAGTGVGEEAAAAPRLERTGREVEAGGSIARLLVKPASTLGYRLRDGSYQRCGAVPGDVVLISRANAERLDALGVTVDPDTDLDEVEEELAEGLFTDEQLAGMGAPELIAYVTQHPDERERVRALEEAGKKRVTVLKATEPTPVEDEEAARAAAAAAGDQGDGTEETSPEDDPEAIAAAQQGNDGGGTGE